MNARRRRSLAPVALLAAGLAAACASIQSPPGGPEDHQPPRLVKVTPDTGRIRVTPKEVVFRFDEVVSERASAAGGLDQLIVISPSDGAPRVSWHREVITARPRRGFRPNTAYTVTLLPGLSDLHGNTLRTGASTFFSTGGEIPRTELSGVVFDWVAAKPAIGAVVEAFRRGDTTFAWTTVTDSSGRFTLRAFPPGSYLVRAMLDANRNRVLDAREQFDTAGVAVADIARIELLAFVHDTIGPRIDRIAIEDSVTLRVDFDKPLDPARPLAPGDFVVLRPDSSAIAVAAILTDSAFTSLRRARDSVRADSARAARPATDTTRPRSVQPAPTPAHSGGGSSIPMPRPGARRSAPPPGARRDTTPAPRPSRPPPQTVAVLKLATPLAPVTAYRLRAVGLRGLVGNARTSDRVFATPKPASADSAAAPAPRRITPATAVPSGAPPAGTPPRP